MLPQLYEETTTDDSKHRPELETMNNTHSTSFNGLNNTIPYETWNPYFPWDPNMDHMSDHFWPPTSDPNEWIEAQWQQPLFTPTSDQAVEEVIFQAPPASTTVSPPPTSRPPPTLQRGQTMTTGIPKGIDSEFDMAYELNTSMGMRWRRKRTASEALDTEETECVVKPDMWKPQISQSGPESRNNGDGRELSPQFAPIVNPAIATLGILGKQLQDATRRQLDLIHGD
ncbi:hypothetical protein FDECE_11544 [Fusarium decemcellulare]|nr:hypothetical protein FDECE_11544 [Fusarium decemcellulare]